MSIESFNNLAILADEQSLGVEFPKYVLLAELTADEKKELLRFGREKHAILIDGIASNAPTFFSVGDYFYSCDTYGMQVMNSFLRTIISRPFILADLKSHIPLRIENDIVQTT